MKCVACAALAMSVLIGCGAPEIEAIEEEGDDLAEVSGPGLVVTRERKGDWSRVKWIRRPDAGASSPAMVRVPASSFTMGCNTAIDPDCRGDEYPRHVVSLAAFEIDVAEVTQAGYDACVKAGTCTTPYGNFNPSLTPARPVRDVLWHQASTYCAWEGKRLPTEAEWERAARGTDGRVYPWGNAAPTCTTASYISCAGGLSDTAALAAGASPVGTLDMAGNIAEWTADFYDAAYYSMSPSVNPTGPATGRLRVVRGGSYADFARRLRTSSRAWGDEKIVYDGVGFRCARTTP